MSKNKDTQDGSECERNSVAVIDIGSNSVRLVVYDGAKRAATPLFNEKVSCGLGRELGSTGRLSEESVHRAYAALTRFRALATQLGASNLHVIATAAAREAENGPEFIERAQNICRVEIGVLSGKKEAKMAAKGVVSGIYKADGLAGDLGGGSLELIDLRKQKLVGGVTLPLGGLRLIDLSQGDTDKAELIVERALADVDWLSVKGKGRPFYAVGGTWRALAKLHMLQTRYPLHMLHNYSMSTDEALKFIHLLNHVSVGSLEGIGEVSKTRRETVPFGALVLEKLIKIAAPSQIVFSTFGVREGVLLQMLDKVERKRDPLIAACEELARLRSRCPEHSYELCQWTDALFQPPGPRENKRQRRLRYAACLLSDIGWRSHPDYRGMQSFNLIAHGAFAGIDHPGRVFLALTLFFRHEGVDATPADDLVKLVSSEDLRRARILGAAFRVIHMVSAATPGIVDKTPIAYERGNKLVLNLPPEHAVLIGERMEKRFRKLAGLLKSEAEIRIADVTPWPAQGVEAVQRKLDEFEDFEGTEEEKAL